MSNVVGEGTLPFPGTVGISTKDRAVALNKPRQIEVAPIDASAKDRLGSPAEVPSAAEMAEQFSANAPIQREGSSQAVPPMADVLVAKNNISMGTLIKDPEKLFEKRLFPRGQEPKGALRDFEEVKGHRLNKSITIEEFVKTEDLIDEEKELPLEKGMRAMALNVNAQSMAGGFVLPLSRVDVVSVVPDMNGETHTEIIVQNVPVLAVDQIPSRDEEKTAYVANTVTVQVTPEQAQQLAKAQRAGSISLITRSYGEDGTATITPATPNDNHQVSPQTTFAAVGNPVFQSDQGDGKVLEQPGQTAKNSPYLNLLRPGEDKGPAQQDPVTLQKKPEGEMASSQPAPKLDGEQGKASKPTQPREATSPSPLASRKLIIRSGDIEFEIDSFDAAVATITKIVSTFNGGFLATVNSEKLANGKVRGAVVVRVPPESLDKLIVDLRKDLGKAGELKSQRIGSQDISKQYTDLESRLRAAQAMQERLLQMIKTGKGEIKDLLQAEKELGVWRTKIEEIEGEVRYYANLVALSTLTITLHEKEILAPSATTETERIQMGLEVEDVDKARDRALAAVAEVKGRIIKSELKQYTAGQYSVLLQFEVAPDAAGPLRDRLKQFGTLARLEIDRLQQTEGGEVPRQITRLKRNDSQFFVSFYNLAKVEPREKTDLQIATRDVPAGYRATPRSGHAGQGTRAQRSAERAGQAEYQRSG